MPLGAGAAEHQVMRKPRPPFLHRSSAVLCKSIFQTSEEDEQGNSCWAYQRVHRVEEGSAWAVLHRLLERVERVVLRAAYCNSAPGCVRTPKPSERQDA